MHFAIYINDEQCSQHYKLHQAEGRLPDWAFDVQFRRMLPASALHIRVSTHRDGDYVRLDSPEGEKLLAAPASLPGRHRVTKEQRCIPRSISFPRQVWDTLEDMAAASGRPLSVCILALVTKQLNAQEQTPAG